MILGDLSANAKLVLFLFGAGGFLGLVTGLSTAYFLLSASERKLNRLRSAVSAIYYAAFWYPDRPVLHETTLWVTLRDAAGFPKGKTPTRLTWTASTLGLGPLEKVEAPQHDAVDQPDGFSS